MKFEKKIKLRLILAVIYTVIGILIIIASNIVANSGEFASMFGLGLAVIGLTNIRRYFAITKNEDLLRKRRVSETDERNILIAYKAKSIAFSIYNIFAGIAVIVLNLLRKEDIAYMIALSVCFMLAIYFISYFIIRKKTQ